MMVRGTTYRERAEAAPALLDSLRQAYVDGKRYGNTKEFPIATLRGVEVSASPMLSSDEMIVKLSVPGRTRSIQAKDFTGQETAPLGLVRKTAHLITRRRKFRGRSGWPTWGWRTRTPHPSATPATSCPSVLAAPGRTGTTPETRTGPVTRQLFRLPG